VHLAERRLWPIFRFFRFFDFDANIEYEL
jgi:hypothetical protein